MKTAQRNIKNGDFTETTLQKNLIYDGRIIKVYNDEISLPNGKTAQREYVSHRGGVCVLAVDDNGRVPLVRQFRYPLGQHLWELPAGKLEEGEVPSEAIARELREEVGVTAKNITLLTEFYPTVGYSSEKIYIYLATDLTYVGNHPDEDEFLEVQYFDKDKLLEMVLDGTITDGKTIIGTLRWAHCAVGTPCGGQGFRKGS